MGRDHFKELWDAVNCASVNIAGVYLVEASPPDYWDWEVNGDWNPPVPADKDEATDLMVAFLRS